MWVLAEQRDMKAVEEFETRFPELRLELAKRVAVVNGLRSAREETPPMPRFRAPTRQPSFWQRPLAVAMSGALLIAVALGAYMGTNRLLSQRAEQASTVITSTVPLLGATPEATPLLPEPKIPDIAPVLEQDPVANENVRVYQRPHSVRIEGAPLAVVLEAISMQTGLDLDVAPGMPDFNVSIAYEGLTGMQMLEDLGRRYQFTALSQGGNKVLIVPIVQPGRGDREPPQPTRTTG